MGNNTVSPTGNQNASGICKSLQILSSELFAADAKLLAGLLDKMKPLRRESRVVGTIVVCALVAVCVASCAPQRCGAKLKRDEAPAAGPSDNGRVDGKLPLCLIDDVALPGNASRFDYQDIDVDNGHLVIAHMGDSNVVIVALADGATLATIDNVPTARGVLAVAAKNRIFASAAASDELVIIDATTFAEINRVPTGAGPDGLAFDPVHNVVAVSAQQAGTVSLIADAGDGDRVDVVVGKDTGNVVFDAGRGSFFVTVTDPDELVEVDPVRHEILARIAVAGCLGAHGLRIHPDGSSALVACEGNATIARVDLDNSAHDVATARSGSGPDVLAIDAAFGWLYVAAESGDLKVFDLGLPGLQEIGSEHPGANAHSVAVDSSTHRVFFPLVRDSTGHPVLRIMQP